MEGATFVMIPREEWNAFLAGQQEILEILRGMRAERGHVDEGLLTRKEMAGFLKISLVTLHDWMNKGLPYHKHQGKVYFVKKDVMGYIKGGTKHEPF